MLLFEHGDSFAELTPADLRNGVTTALARIDTTGDLLIIPPDITRLHSRAGELTRYIYEAYPDRVRAILPALGTHRPMDSTELTAMFGDIPRHLFLEHRWRTDCVQAGTVPAEIVAAASDGIVDEAFPVRFNGLLLERTFGCIVSISQVVPHEVAGMAGYTKNLAVGLGGAENIHRTHFLGAAYGMERVMGRADSPVRRVLNYAVERFLGHLPIVHVITVVGRGPVDGLLKVRGLFIGVDDECYRKAAALSQEVNIHSLDAPLEKVVVYLDPVEYKSTWLGNKSIYRTRMALADGGELVVLAPGITTFGEDEEIDALIRQFGYRGTPATMAAVKKHPSLKNNLSAAAHLIHGSSEGRFSITYCAGGLTAKEVEGAGFGYAPLDAMAARYNPATLSEGYNRMPDGEEIYYISSPGTGLWASKERV
jgi:nickel-dependent lactate racemase